MHKTSQIPSKKWPLGGVGLGQGAEPKTAEHQGEICFLVIFGKFLMLHFVAKI